MTTDSPSTTDTPVLLILGAPDPEMATIEAIGRAAAGCEIVHATDGLGQRVTPRTAYAAAGTTDDSLLHARCCGGGLIILVECAPATNGASWAWERTGMVPGWESHSDCAALVMVADHHRPGDPGYGRPPAEYLSASSIGQVLRLLGVVLLGSHRDDACRVLGEHEGIHGWAWTVAGRSEVADDHSSTWPSGKHGQWGAPPPPAWAEELDVDAILTVAAADHCLGAAYRGECPGIDPAALLDWRIASRAAFQGRPESAIRADIERARAALRAAPWVTVGEHTHTYDHDWASSVCDGCARDLPRVRDMRRPEPVAELVEASMIEGAEYTSGPLIDRDGRHKYTVSGSPETVRAWMDWADDRLGLVDIYGDPARGFAGGYDV